MIKLKPLHYIAIDFETTGLDPQKDEPIQIGLIQMDYDREIIQQYQTYIRPLIPLDQLSQTVTQVTGITSAQLSQAPTMQEIIPQIKQIIGSDPVFLIWHNVWFDYKFLSNYFQIDATLIDTYPLSQSLIHYSASYALDVLGMMPEIQSTFIQLRWVQKVQFHDALYDVKQSIALLHYLYHRLNILITDYPTLSKSILKSDHIRYHILDLHHQNLDLIYDENLPLLSKPVKTKNTSQTPSIYQLKQATHYDINNASLEDIVLSCITSPCVIAVSHRSKIDHIKNILDTHGIFTVWYTKPDQIIQADRLQSIINQPELTDYELDFIIKYCSLHQYGYSLIPAQSQYDQMILHYLAGIPKASTQPIILCTHQWLYHIIESEEYLDYHLYMLDHDRRYTTYNQYRSIKFDPIYFLNQVSIISYKTKFLSQGDNLLSKFEYYCQMRVWLFQIAAQHYQQNHGQIYDIWPLVDLPEFEQSINSLQNCKLQYKLIKSALDDYDCRMIQKYLDHIDQLHNSIVKLVPKTSGSQTHYTVDQAVTYTDYSEFQDFVHRRQSTNFCLLYTQWCTDIHQAALWNISIKQRVWYTQTVDHTQIIALIKQYPKTIVLSNNKSASQKLMYVLIQAGIQESTKCLVENITGWSGKNISQLKHFDRVCLIGGLEFIHTALAKDWHADHIIAYQISWPLKHLILKEVVRYND